MTDAQRIAQMVAGMAELLGVTASRERIHGYVAALADLSADQVAAGIHRAVKGWHYADMPKPAHIRDAVEGHSRHPQTRWPDGWRDHCPHGTCAVPTQCAEAWAWVRATVLAQHPELTAQTEGATA